MESQIDQTTAESKELKVFNVKGSALYQIGFEGGGTVPAELGGRWTDPKLAEAKIEQYNLKQNELAVTKQINEAAKKAFEEAQIQDNFDKIKEKATKKANAKTAAAK